MKDGERLIRNIAADTGDGMYLAARDVIAELDDARARVAALEAIEQRARYWAERGHVAADGRTVAVDILDAAPPAHPAKTTNEE